MTTITEMLKYTVDRMKERDKVIPLFLSPEVHKTLLGDSIFSPSQQIGGHIETFYGVPIHVIDEFSNWEDVKYDMLKDIFIFGNSFVEIKKRGKPNWKKILSKQEQ